VNDRLVVFGREPRPGTVKTRLASAIGATAAAAVYSVLLEHTIEVAKQTSAKASVSLADAPDDSGWAAALGIPTEVQRAGDLGERIAECFQRHFEAGARRVVVVGSDNPRIQVGHIEAALRALAAAPVVLGPAEDGGYWLLGQRRPGEDLFSGIPWSSPRTMGATRDRLRALSVRWLELETLPDIDSDRDLKRAINDHDTPVDLRLRLEAVREVGQPRSQIEGPR
jgi:rSAM/selenodomain-associated transferase 1